MQVAARFLQHGGDAQRILHGQARTRGALDEVDGRPAHDDGELGPHDLAHAADDLERQFHAVLQAAAVLVGAVVGSQRHEARQDAAHARHDLDGVEAGFLAHARRVEVLLLERLDLLERHGADALVHSSTRGDCGGFGVLTVTSAFAARTVHPGRSARPVRSVARAAAQR